MKKLKSHRCQDGEVTFWEHDAKATGTAMRFSTFVPPGELRGCLVWLSGLTCTDENFQAKAGAQRVLAETGLMVVCPDTSPRGLHLPGEHESWDFGSGAGFYVDATTPGYRDHYRMRTYVADELYDLVGKTFGVRDRLSLAGHSMGGHGALVLGLREPEKFRSLSAFAPIGHPTACHWGVKAFTGYLGNDREAWKAYDATELLRAGRRHPKPLLIDQGTADDFLAEQLLTPRLVTAAETAGQPVRANFREGYDHSYYYVATFIAEHVRFHAEALGDVD